MLSRETSTERYAHARLEYHATVRELPSNERPRERLQHFGEGALSLAELLAIVLRTGTRGDNALELANKLLSKYGGLPGLVRADFRELCAEHGMGEAKSAQVKAALEIGRRLALVQVDTRYKISTPTEAANLVMLEMAYLDTEQMRILVLDSKGQLVEKVSLYQGTANSSVLRAAEVFRPAIIRNCPAIILCHNHPSGDPTPSPVIWRKFCQEEEGGRGHTRVLSSAVFDLGACPQPPETNPTGSQVTPAFSALVPRLLPTRLKPTPPQSIKVRRRVLPPPSERVCALSAWGRWRSPGGE